MFETLGESYLNYIFYKKYPGDLSGKYGGSSGGNSAEGGSVGARGAALQPTSAPGGFGNIGGDCINSEPRHGSGVGCTGSIGGAGGIGISINITGTDVYYGGGGAWRTCSWHICYCIRRYW